MRAQLVHLAGPWRGRTWTYPHTNLLLGTDPDAHVVFPPGCGVAPRHAEIAYSAGDCAFYLRALDGEVFVNRRQVREAQLMETDLLELGVGGPRLRFHVYVPPGAVSKPVRAMLADAGAVAQESGVFAFTRSFTRDLLTHATWQLKVFFPLVFLATTGLVAYFAGWLGARAPVMEIRAKERAQDHLLARIHDELVRGVCLVHAIYGFRRTGSGGSEFLLDDVGDRLEKEYTGSGFLVTATGAIITNRHIVRPWLEHEHHQAILRLGCEPTFFHFTVTFPGREPLHLDPMQAKTHDGLDVALLLAPAPAVAGVPVLSLSAKPPEPECGHRVFVIGFPTGVRAVLAKADPVLRQRLSAQPDTPMADVIAMLAEAKAIRPLVTQGVLADVTSTSLVYDAGTTLGGSGGPVLGEDGAVLGVNYAIMREFESSNFGVPIRFARELLPR